VSVFSLKLDAYAGSSIEACCSSACQISDQLGLTVVFDFNGVKCIAVPNGDPEKLAEHQQSEQARKTRGPFDRELYR